VRGPLADRADENAEDERRAHATTADATKKDSEIRVLLLTHSFATHAHVIYIHTYNTYIHIYI